MSENKQSNHSFRLFLQGELVKRCKNNSKYSLRAFAKSLGVTPSYLSMILNSKRRVSKSLVRRLIVRLDLSQTVISTLVDTSEFGKSIDDSMGKKSDYIYQQLALDHFHFIADWYHYAILELISLNNFKPNLKWIANSLGISVNEAKAGVERLVRLELISITDQGNWINVSGNNTNIDNPMIISARKSLQRQILTKALAALDDVPIENRDQSSMTLAIDSSKLNEAKKMLMKFRRDFTKHLQESKIRNHVYHLSLSFYPVTQFKTTHEELNK